MEWTCSYCTYDNKFQHLACEVCKKPKASQMKTDVMADAEDAKRYLVWAEQELASLHHALELRRTKLQEKEHALEGKLSLEDDEVPDEVKHGEVPLSPGVFKRKRVYETELSKSPQSTSPQSPAPQPKKLKVAEHHEDSRLLTLHPLMHPPKPKARNTSSNQWEEYNFCKCTDEDIHNRVLDCSKMSFVDPNLCKLSLVTAEADKRAKTCMEQGTKFFDITLSESTQSAHRSRYQRFAIRIVQAFLLPGFVKETMESHAFLLTFNPLHQAARRQRGRTKFAKLINSHTDPALINFLKEGRLLPLSQLGELLRRLVKMTEVKRPKVWIRPEHDRAYPVPDDVGSVGWGASGATTSCCGDGLTHYQKYDASLALLLSVLQQAMGKSKRSTRPLLQKSRKGEDKLRAPESHSLLRQLLSL
jgi:hypothetical protein